MPQAPGRFGLMRAKHGRLTGSGVLDEEADHVAERGAPLGDTGEPPQGALLHGLGAGQTVERQVVLLLVELLGPGSEACGRRAALRASAARPTPLHRPAWRGEKSRPARRVPSTFPSHDRLFPQIRKHCQTAGSAWLRGTIRGCCGTQSWVNEQRPQRGPTGGPASSQGPATSPASRTHR